MPICCDKLDPTTATTPIVARTAGKDVLYCIEILWVFNIFLYDEIASLMINWHS